MQYMGEEWVLPSNFDYTEFMVTFHSGYLESCRSIVTTTRKIAHAIRTEIPELYVLGNPPVSVVAFASRNPQVKALKVGDLMASKGWHLNALQNPNAVHIAVTVYTIFFSINAEQPNSLNLLLVEINHPGC
jgi:glutamate/tyrosine decarboxylase-like PLP-dependent enzyme